jgi:hypothetical protein
MLSRVKDKHNGAQTNYFINKGNSLDKLVTVRGWLKHCHMLTTFVQKNSFQTSYEKVL